MDGIPFELWEPAPKEQRDEHRVITAAPASGTGVNLDTLRPFVFAPSVAGTLGIEMPMVASGTYASATLSAAATGDAVAKSAAVPETAATWTPSTTTPHRVGAALRLDPRGRRHGRPG